MGCFEIIGRTNIFSNLSLFPSPPTSFYLFISLSSLSLSLSISFSLSCGFEKDVRLRGKVSYCTVCRRYSRPFLVRLRHSPAAEHKKFILPNIFLNISTTTLPPLFQDYFFCVGSIHAGPYSYSRYHPSGAILSITKPNLNCKHLLHIYLYKMCALLSLGKTWFYNRRFSTVQLDTFSVAASFCLKY